MASKLLIPILLGTICMLTLVTASENGNFKHSQVISMPTATAEKNTLVLLTQWPFSYCCPKKQESCCLKPYTTTDFIIHTIWTLNSKRQIQMDCNGPLFDEHKLSRPIVEFSRVFWPSLNCSYDDLEYWKTEWERHGRCSDLSQLDWFKLGIKLFEPDFIVGFNAEGIVPGGKYNADQFKKALKLAVGKDVDLRCNTNSATGERQLYEVLICYDPEDKKVIDCGPHNVPGPGTWACPGNVVLPRKPCKPSSERRCDSDA
jgi:ribonuclease T2